MDIIKEAVYPEVVKFAGKYQQQFLINSPYCAHRQTMNKETCCNTCESSMMCTIFHYMVKQATIIEDLFVSLKEANAIMKTQDNLNQVLIDTLKSKQEVQKYIFGVVGNTNYSIH